MAKKSEINYAQFVFFGKIISFWQNDFSYRTEFFVVFVDAFRPKSDFDCKKIGMD